MLTMFRLSADPPCRLPNSDVTIAFGILVVAGCRIEPSNHQKGDERQRKESCEQVKGEMGVEF